MKTTDFEKQLQEELDEEITIRTNPNHDDIAGVYWREMFLGVAVPPIEINELVSLSYRDAVGNTYRGYKDARELVEGKLAKFKQAFIDDPELFNDIKD